MVTAARDVAGSREVGSSEAGPREVVGVKPSAPADRRRPPDFDLARARSDADLEKSWSAALRSSKPAACCRKV